MTPDHWLITAARKSGLGDASHSGLPVDRPVDEAWARVSEFLQCSPEELARAVAEAFKLEVADLEKYDEGALSLVPQKLAEKLNVLPLFASDRELIVATSEPVDYEAERQIGFVSSRRTTFRVAPPAALKTAIESAYASKEKKAHFGGADLDEAYEKVRPDQAAIARAPVHTRNTAVVKICRLIVYEAAKAGASEIHMSLTTSHGRVQLKVAGKLQTILRVPVETLMTAAERIRGMADVGDTEGRVTRTLHVRVERTPYEITVQTVPGYPHHLVLGLQGQRIETEGWKPRTDESEGHVLVVDDDEGGRLLMRTILEKNGFRVTEADDGSTALPFLDRADDVDAILLDLMMKNVDGDEVLNRVRKSRKLAALPVVILTASQDPEDERRLLRGGADDYLRKPVDPHQLVERLRAVLKRAQSYEG